MIDLANLPDLDTLTDDALLELLNRVAADIEATNVRGETLYELRLALYKAARTRTPAVTQIRLAEAARVSEEAVIQTIRADRLKAEMAEAHAAGKHPADGKRVKGCPTCRAERS